MLPSKFQDLFFETKGDFTDPNGLRSSRNQGGSSLYADGKQVQTGTGGKKNSPFTGSVTYFDGISMDIANQHILANHGDEWGINDPLPSEQGNSKWPRVRTRVNKENFNNFMSNYSSAASNSNLEVFQDVKIKDQLGRLYYNSVTQLVQGGIKIGGNKYRGTIGYKLTPFQLKILRDENRLI